MNTTYLNVTVDWNAVEGQTKDEHFGINVYRAVADAGNSKYRSNMNYMSPGIIRFHNVDYMKDSSKDHGLIDTKNKTWDVQKVVNTIQASIDMFGADQPKRMFNIPSWPSWMDANNDGYLDSDRFDEYAKLCADLVKIVNKDNNLGVQYWEITNEKDIEYFSIFHTKSGWGKLIDPNQPDRLDELITIYNKVAEAMKAVDPSIKVGGPSIARPDLTPFYEPFVKGTIDNLDFFTYHYYPTGSASTPDQEVFNATNSIGKYTKSIVDTLKKLSPDREIPAILGEYNISWTWETHDPRMANNKGAIFDALSIIKAIENGASASLSWNEKDGSYGKTSYNDTLRPGGELLHLFNQYLVGNRIATTSNNSNIETFAIDRPGSHKAYVLINSSNSSQEVAVTFNNWNSTSSNVSKHIISDSGYSQELTAWDTVNNNTIVLPANSVILFEDDSIDVDLPPTSNSGPTLPNDTQGNTDNTNGGLPPTSNPDPTPPNDTQGNTDNTNGGLPQLPIPTLHRQTIPKVTLTILMEVCPQLPIPTLHRQTIPKAILTILMEVYHQLPIPTLHRQTIPKVTLTILMEVCPQLPIPTLHRQTIPKAILTILMEVYHRLPIPVPHFQTIPKAILTILMEVCPQLPIPIPRFRAIAKVTLTILMEVYHRLPIPIPRFRAIAKVTLTILMEVYHRHPNPTPRFRAIAKAILTILMEVYHRLPNPTPHFRAIAKAILTILMEVCPNFQSRPHTSERYPRQY
ncbi:hypothetical protein AB0758_43170 [Tolypothrix bouteillei VB521301_2]|uniref:GH39 family glycosyl hydrolase n=1 Tax=Tolypothrix bouteillei TaxID=1246981 RepID=UPI0038B4A235